MRYPLGGWSSDFNSKYNVFRDAIWTYISAITLTELDMAAISAAADRSWFTGFYNTASDAINSASYGADAAALQAMLLDMMVGAGVPGNGSGGSGVPGVPERDSSPPDDHGKARQVFFALGLAGVVWYLMRGRK